MASGWLPLLVSIVIFASLDGGYGLSTHSNVIQSYQQIAEKIMFLAVNGNARHQAYNRLAEMVDRFGYRMSGTDALENAIDYMVDELKKDRLENVHTEPVMIPVWQRGPSYAAIVEPHFKEMKILALGSSIGTMQGINAPVLVVKSFDELKKRAKEAKGRIVVFNEAYVGYDQTVKYRYDGATAAAEVGAVAALVRSVTPFSVYSPHAGQMHYLNGSTNDTHKIPSACITVEDAELLQRHAQRGENIRIFLKFETRNLPPVKSRNTVAEIVGWKYPEQVVLVSGHLDSWDVGQGAMDDGSGVMISWQALSLINYLGLRPKRTIRALFWTAEEQGGVGGKQYYNAHKTGIQNMDLVVEADSGTFSPRGLLFTGNYEATEIMKMIMQLLRPLNASGLVPGAGGEDIEDWRTAGVPSASLLNAPNDYFIFHHSNGDTMTVQNPGEMDVSSAILAVAAYVVADLDFMLPRN